MDNTNESKAERFVRLAEPRVSRACEAISLIGYLAASSYEYTDKQVESMFAALQEELVEAAKRVQQQAAQMQAIQSIAN